MRVSTRSLYLGIQQRLLQLNSEIKNANMMISSGVRVNRPSDDPIAAVDILGFRNSLTQMEQYNRNMEMGASWLNAGESALTQVLDVAVKAKEIAIQMANATQSATTRESLAANVGHLLDEAIALANTKVGESYIFSGYRTATVPLVKATVGTIETAQYQGDGNDFQISIGKDETLVLGRNGQTVFMDSNLFDTLGNLKKALEDNDLVGIGQALDQLTEAENHLNVQIADIGARTERLETKQGILEGLSLSIEEQLSRIQDTDIAEAVIRLKQTELAYEAALLSSSRISQLSMMNYL